MKRLRLHLQQVKLTGKVPNLCAKIIQQKHKWCDTLYPVLYWKSYFTQCRKIDPIADEDFLKKATNFLNDMGEVLYVKQISTQREDVIVLEPRWLCDRVFGPMLATNVFSQYVDKFEKKTFYPFSDIEKVLGKHANTELLIDLLEHCELLCKASLKPKDSGEELSFLLSGLLTEKMPGDQWGVGRRWNIYFGRRFECHDETDSFTAGFFPRLQVRLYKKFLQLDHTPKGLWKNGIKICHGVECLVFMTDHRRAVNICVRAGKKQLIGKCHEILEMVREDIRDIFKQMCPGNNLDQRILSAQSLATVTDIEKLKYYTEQDLIDAEEKGQLAHSSIFDAVEDTTDLLCQGYDITMLKQSGKHCDVKWMLQETRRDFTRRMDVERASYYPDMAELMGIGYQDVKAYEADRTERPVTDFILEEWSRRCAMTKSHKHDDHNFTPEETHKSRVCHTGTPPASPSQYGGKTARTAGEKQKATEGDFHESNFHNLLAILHKMQRSDMVDLIEEMFQKIKYHK
ncbi:death-associated protein kinase 1-like [Ptychodera flava]|uniref:death-associated protein kinase 1-like n=1 Tax=Ptychodera flava TaxID=63121 RepID=UPI003969C3BC